MTDKFIYYSSLYPPGTGGVLQLVPEHAAAADLSSAASTPSPLSCTATQLGAAQPVQVTTSLSTTDLLAMFHKAMTFHDLNSHSEASYTQRKAASGGTKS